MITGVGPWQVTGSKTGTNYLIKQSYEVIPMPKNTGTLTEMNVQVGDFINYKAGNWTQQDLEKLGVKFDSTGNITDYGPIYMGEDLFSNTANRFKFGGFTNDLNKIIDKKITNSKDENINVEIDDDIYNIICLVSEKIKDNVRELEGSFRSIISLSQLTGEKADAAFAKSMLKDMFVSQDIITPEKIKSSVSKYYKIRISDLDSETRKNTVSYPRQIAMYLCRTMTDYSFPKIGTLFGNKHYSTVKHACDKIESEIKTNKELAAAIEHIKERIME